MPYIVSKASQDIEYPMWTTSRSGQHQAKKAVVIKGGANVINKKTLETPTGTVTEVTSEELEFLLSNSTFKRHVENGWLTVEKSESSAQKKAKSVDKDSEGYTKKDGSAQLTPEDFKRRGQKPPKVGVEE